MSKISGCSCTNRTPGPSALLSMRKMHPHTCTPSSPCQQMHLGDVSMSCKVLSQEGASDFTGTYSLLWMSLTD